RSPATRRSRDSHGARYVKVRSVRSDACSVSGSNSVRHTLTFTDETGRSYRRSRAAIPAASAVSRRSVGQFAARAPARPAAGAPPPARDRGGAERARGTGGGAPGARAENTPTPPPFQGVSADVWPSTIWVANASSSRTGGSRCSDLNGGRPRDPRR